MGNEQTSDKTSTDGNDLPPTEGQFDNSIVSDSNSTTKSPVEIVEEEVKNEMGKWKDMTQNGVPGVCQPLAEQLHIEAAKEGLESWEADEEQKSEPNKMVVDKCIQLLIDMPSGKTDLEEDRNTARDMKTFANLFVRAMNVLESYNIRREVEARQDTMALGKNSRSRSGGGNDDDDDNDDEVPELSSEIYCHEDDDTVPIARKIIRACLVFLSEVGKLTTTDGTDAWFGMKDAIKSTKVVPAVMRLLLQHPTHNSFVFWGLNALYFCCRDGATNDWENIEAMRNAGGLEMVRKLNNTCVKDENVLVHVQLLHTMMTMKDDDDENLLDASLEASAQRVIEPSPAFGHGRSTNAQTFRPGYY